MPQTTKTSISLSGKAIHPRKILLAGALGSLLILGACAQQSDPNYYEVSRGNTQSDARHRAQGRDTTVAPSQLQLGFGDQNQDKQKSAASDDQGHVPAASRSLPHNLADTRTYLGTIPCASTAACSVQRMTLTIAPDGQWRAKNNDLSGKLNDTHMGCWAISNNDPIRLNLKTDDHVYATMEFTRANVLKLVRLNGQQPVLSSSLTRQADVDPIDELAEKPAQNCNTQN